MSCRIAPISFIVFVVEKKYTCICRCAEIPIFPQNSSIFVTFIFLHILHIYFAEYYFWYNKVLFRFKTGKTSQ